jgi:hypothetical protein
MSLLIVENNESPWRFAGPPDARRSRADGEA